jgi:hypothetical protein
MSKNGNDTDRRIDRGSDIYFSERGKLKAEYKKITNNPKIAIIKRARKRCELQADKAEETILESKKRVKKLRKKKLTKKQRKKIEEEKRLCNKGVTNAFLKDDKLVFKKK